MTSITDANATTLYAVRGHAAWITLNCPDKRNALSAALVNGLYAHLRAAMADDAVRCIVITGSGPAFCAGADLKNPPAQVPGPGAASFTQVLQTIIACPKPVLAAVNGQAFGGGLGLLGAADIVVIAQEAQCSFSEVRLGVIPAIISVVCLPKLGKHHGMRLFLTGERFDGAAAVHYGLAHACVPLSELHTRIQQDIDAIALGGPMAVQEAKQLVQRIGDQSMDEDFALATSWSRRLFSSAEAAEGMQAFGQKRSPYWVKG